MAFNGTALEQYILTRFANHNYNKKESDTSIKYEYIWELTKDIQVKYLTTLEQITWMIFNRALYYTPIDTGKLLSSASFNRYDGGFKIQYDADYAVYVHEIPDNYHEAPSQYKFLEDAAYEIYNEYIKNVEPNMKLEITYNPLVLYIGCKGNNGTNLISKKKQEKKQTMKQFREMIESMEYKDIVNKDSKQYSKLVQAIENQDNKKIDKTLKKWASSTKKRIKN